MAKKTVQPDTPVSSERTPSHRRAPVGGRRTTSRRTAAPDGGVGASAAATADESIDRAADVSVAGGSDSGRGHTPTSEEIAEAAYRRYLERGGEHGRDFDDWLEAERSLRGR